MKNQPHPSTPSVVEKMIKKMIDFTPKKGLTDEEREKFFEQRGDYNTLLQGFTKDEQQELIENLDQIIMGQPDNERDLAIDYLLIIFPDQQKVVFDLIIKNFMNYISGEDKLMSIKELTRSLDNTYLASDRGHLRQRTTLYETIAKHLDEIMSPPFDTDSISELIFILDHSASPVERAPLFKYVIKHFNSIKEDLNKHLLSKNLNMVDYDSCIEPLKDLFPEHENLFKIEPQKIVPAAEVYFDCMSEIYNTTAVLAQATGNQPTQTEQAPATTLFTLPKEIIRRIAATSVPPCHQPGNSRNALAAAQAGHDSVTKIRQQRDFIKGDESCIAMSYYPPSC